LFTSLSFFWLAGSKDSSAAVSSAAGQLGTQSQKSRTPPLSAQQAQEQLQQARQHSSAANGSQPSQVLHQYRQQHPQPTYQHFPMQQFEIESETPVHQRYLTVYNRKVRFSAPERPSEVGDRMWFDLVSALPVQPVQYICQLDCALLSTGPCSTHVEHCAWRVVLHQASKPCTAPAPAEPHIGV
jgi:hypothetical protein